MKKLIVTIFIILIILSNVIPSYAQNEYEGVKAQVIEIKESEEISSENEPKNKVQNVKVRILEGEYENEEYDMVYVISEDTENAIISNVELQEEENILVTVSEKDGEITSLTYIEKSNNNYTEYVIVIILAISLFIFGIKKGLMPIIVYFMTIVLVIFLLIFSMKMGWNLILVSSILAFLITVFYITRANGINNKTFVMILGSLLSIAFAGILISILFDVMVLTNINIKITDNFVNIKDLICSCIIVVSCGLSNLIILVKLNIDTFFNKSYKTKSDNIIEGQRSLKL